MKIPLPCNFGEKIEYEGKLLPMCGVSWFAWSYGVEYTYFLETGNNWNPYTFFTSRKKEWREEITLNDKYTLDKSFTEHGYPLTGSGYIHGIHWEKGKLYADVILSSRYSLHLKVECNEDGSYKDRGTILYPSTPSFETEEKRCTFLRKDYYYLAKII